MAGSSGTFGSVVYTTGGTTLVEGIGEWSMDISMTSNEVSEFGDVWKQKVAGMRDATGSFSGNGVPGGTVQESLRNAMIGGSVISLRLYEDQTHFWTVGSAYLTGLGRAISTQGKLDATYNWESNGQVTYGTA